MSADPDRWRILREGYLDVKAPPDSPERILHKAWRRLWVCVAVFQPPGRGEPHLILQFSRKPDDEPEKQLKASRDGLRLFRCKSGSRGLRTWGLSSGSSLLIYLADETEEDTQEWMHTVREGLWPTISSPQTGESHDVSLIDDEKSFASGLLGVYGRLVKSSDDAICVVHPHWKGTQMRWRVEDILDVRLVRNTGKDEESEAGVFNLSVKSTKKDARVLQFYCKSASTAVDWIQSILDPKHVRHVNTKKDSNSRKLSSDNTTSEYAAVQKSKKTEPKQGDDPEPDAPTNLYGKIQPTGHLHLLNIPGHFLDASLSSPILKRADEKNCEDKPVFPGDSSDNVYGKAQTTSYLHLSNVPGHFLDASMNSPILKRSGNGKILADKPASTGDSGDDSPGEIYDHIYEEMNSETKEGRSDTVYEEMGDADEDYVPPMPPTLPARQPSAATNRPEAPQGVTATPDAATLRLQKLSASLTEALKLVEEGPKTKDLSKRSKIVRRVSSKKSKSLHHSPTMEVKAIPDVSHEKPVHRAASEPEIQVDADLPLRPFQPVVDGKVCPKKKQFKREKTHESLDELLKSLEAVNDPCKPSASEPQKTVDLVPGQVLEPVKNSKVSSPVRNEEAETEYMEMR